MVASNGQEAVILTCCTVYVIGRFNADRVTSGIAKLKSARKNVSQKRMDRCGQNERGRSSHTSYGFATEVLTLVYSLCVKMHLSFWHAVLRRPRVFSRAFGCRASKGTGGTLPSLPGSRPSSVARALELFKVAELALLSRGPASLSQEGAWKIPHFRS